MSYAQMWLALRIRLPARRLKHWFRTHMCSSLAWPRVLARLISLFYHDYTVYADAMSLMGNNCHFVSLFAMLLNSTVFVYLFEAAAMHKRRLWLSRLINKSLLSFFFILSTIAIRAYESHVVCVCWTASAITNIILSSQETDRRLHNTRMRGHSFVRRIADTVIYSSKTALSSMFMCVRCLERIRIYILRVCAVVYAWTACHRHASRWRNVI